MPMLTRNRLAAALTVACLLPTGLEQAHAGAPDYHLQRIDVPDAINVHVARINNHGDAIGYYTNLDYYSRAFLRRADGSIHTLALPDGGEIESTALALNDQGQIVGTFTEYDPDTFEADVTTLMWHVDSPGTYTVVSHDPVLKFQPNAINDAGVIAGMTSQGGAFRAALWTPDAGLVDSGLPTGTPGEQALWAAINDHGDLAGGWYFPGSPTFAVAGHVDVPGMAPVVPEAADWPSMVNAINDAGVAAGYMNMDGSPDRVPVTFVDGETTVLAGATLGLARGYASDINADGVVVGRAEGTAFPPTFKAFVYIDGVAHDLYERVDDPAGISFFLNAAGVNDAGVVVGVGRVGEFDVASFIAYPAPDDTLFANGFE